MRNYGDSLLSHFLRRFSYWLALALYLAMGWAVLLAAGLSPAVFWTVTAGGIVYTVGVGFHLAARLPFHNTIWHVFVLAGSVLFFIAVAVLIANLPMGG